MNATVFLRVIDRQDKDAALLAAVHSAERIGAADRFDVNPERFEIVPRSPFAYWVSENLRMMFSRLPPFEAEGRIAKVGLQTSDDLRFVRLWWEAPQGKRWLPFAKGGTFSPYYADLSLLIGYSRSDQVGLMAFGRFGRGADCYFRPGLTWPRRTQRGLSLRALPAGCVFADKGPAAFVAGDDANVLLALLAITNSRPFKAAVDMQMAFGSYEVGVLQRTPVPLLTVEAQVDLAALGRRAWSLTRALDTRTESSHAFVLPAVLQVCGDDLTSRSAFLHEQLRAVSSEIAHVQVTIDDRCFVLYGIDDNDRHAITDGFGGESSVDESTDDLVDADETDDVDASDTRGFAVSLVSWCVGVAFGRFDLRLATGERPLPSEPDPFDPQPGCSPAMLTGDDGQPLASASAEYPITTPTDGILVDDAGHHHDLIESFRQVFGAVFKNRAVAWWNDVAEALGANDHDLRRWLASEFFEFHLKRYSKSRRKAPIYWQISTPSRRYSIWLYAHRISDDTFYKLEREVLAPKLAHEDRKLTTLIQDGGPTPTTARERKAIETQEQFVEELRAMMAEIRLVKQLWKPNLDDGIVLVCAPLWRLTYHKAWQKELKEKWDDLCAGKYDWAHIAMHLWPERVVPKCATDRSLAIAHGLEGTFWSEIDGKWKPREVPQSEIDRLIAVRTSEAVKQALHDLLNAPAPGGTAKRGRSTSRRNRQNEAAE